MKKEKRKGGSKKEIEAGKELAKDIASVRGATSMMPFFVYYIVTSSC